MVGSCLNAELDPEVCSYFCNGEQARLARVDIHELLLKPATLIDYLGSLVRCCELSVPALPKDSVCILMLLARRTSRRSTRGPILPEYFSGRLLRDCQPTTAAVWRL